ncbi:MAG: bifunctional 2-C-methyl-D-erythritol 4-phosphate cytidylyltransferase/2-C-methyl-D-erythritol 2,4-cyclodiphosphate synthase [Caulobacterales bacterium]|jgi:2-C-methyl-D-erythritol 4-phosphate cytidylyltransferase/2-C-methyl-D-erythritol 2,4-cyclodiphosphate synthase
MPVDALIVAAGAGTRVGAGLPKQYRTLSGKPVLRWSLEAFRKDQRFRRIFVAVDPTYLEQAKAIASGIGAITFVTGGATRTQTVQKSLIALQGDPPDLLFIHDAARPGLSTTVLDALFEAMAKGAAGSAPALPLPDALKRADRNAAVISSVSREGLFRVQTPQAFHFQALANAYAKHAGNALDDDLAIAELAGLPIVLVAGDQRLQKLTFEEDFAMIAPHIGHASQLRVGQGFDAHRLGPGDQVTLCGVKVPSDRGLIGHSDADVAWHALTDAILGAIAAGDIGDHFPPTQAKWKGVESGVFLRHAMDLLRAGGARLVNVDLTLICERPKIQPHRAAMRASTAKALGLPLNAVSIKATTTEGMGFTGRGEGIAAQAAVMVLCPPETEPPAQA